MQTNNSLAPAGGPAGVVALVRPLHPGQRERAHRHSTGRLHLGHTQRQQHRMRTAKTVSLHPDFIISFYLTSPTECHGYAECCECLCGDGDAVARVDQAVAAPVPAVLPSLLANMSYSDCAKTFKVIWPGFQYKSLTLPLFAFAQAEGCKLFHWKQPVKYSKVFTKFEYFSAHNWSSPKHVGRLLQTVLDEALRKPSLTSINKAVDNSENWMASCLLTSAQSHSDNHRTLIVWLPCYWCYSVCLELDRRAGHHVFPGPLTLHRHRGNCNGTVKLGRAVIIELIYDFVTFLAVMPQQVDLCCQREKR